MERGSHSLEPRRVHHPTLVGLGVAAVALTSISSVSRGRIYLSTPTIPFHQQVFRGPPYGMIVVTNTPQETSWGTRPTCLDTKTRVEDITV